jgi:hypothetical protein
MRRLQTKCMFVSAVVHSLLLVALFVGSAFLPAKPKLISPTPFKIFTVTDSADTSGGGNPDAVKPVVEQPPAPAAAPTPVIQQPVQAPTPVF